MAYRAVWNGAVIAEDEVKRVEGNVYFPPEDVNREFLEDSRSHTRCYWKGKASYYHVGAKGDVAPGAAFYYPSRGRSPAT